MNEMVLATREETGTESKRERMQYPSVFRRYLSTLFDLLVIWVGVYLITRIPGLADSGLAIAVTVALLLVAYEPVLTTYFCTAGQWLFRIRVRTFAGKKHISLGQAYGRLFVKYLLGTISILTIPARIDRRAIHDFASKTIVIEAADALQASSKSVCDTLRDYRTAPTVN